MNPFNITEYPVFEADQVLSNKHLNNILSFLEEQDRDTRIKLLGIGIVCGLKVTISGNSIKISSGTAITSLGFLINFEETSFTHFRDIELSSDFLTPELDGHPEFNNIFDFNTPYNLLLNTPSELLESATDSLGAINTPFLNNKVVVLLLETKLVDLKNCVATNCDDKGKKIVFNLKPILVSKSWVENFELLDFYPKHLKKLSLKRFNVPKTALITGSDIYDAFKIVIDDTILADAYDSIKLLYNDYKHIIDPQNQLSLLNNTLPKLSASYSTYKAKNIQYLYDWLSDIHNVYNEILDFIKWNPNTCCANKNSFPFHVALGVSDTNTLEVKDNDSLRKYRNVFIKTGILSQEEERKLQRFKNLFQKLYVLINNFKIEASSEIKITPCILGDTSLAEKAIPYYYDKSKMIELNNVWNDEKTSAFRNDEILSYHAPLYSTIDQVKDPLLYDIEKYNFFRIEGHIGKPYDYASAKIKSIQELHRLPFKVIGLNAVDETGRTIAFNNKGGEWDDLEIEYDLAKTKLINVLEYFKHWLVENIEAVKKRFSAFDEKFPGQFNLVIIEFKKLLTEDLTEFLENFTTFYAALESLNDLFLIQNHYIDIAQEDCFDNPILQELESRIDEFKMIMLEDSFIIIYKEARRRWINALKKTFLKDFSNNHPAIEHKAGVTKGGTFCLIYSDYSIFETKSSSIYQSTPIFELIPSVIVSTGIPTEQIPNLTTQNYQRQQRNTLDYLRADSPIATPCNQESIVAVEEFKLNITRKANLILEYPLAAYFNDNLLSTVLASDIATTNNDSTPQKVILGDFYIPYSCCGDGDAINIVINTTEAETKPKIEDFSHPDFNNSDFITNNPT